MFHRRDGLLKNTAHPQVAKALLKQSPPKLAKVHSDCSRSSELSVNGGPFASRGSLVASEKRGDGLQNLVSRMRVRDLRV